mmetsp:Transcript_32125/g.67007  ORF Transcript_32125/g.67007 Transcript_32125/m.67007 type:complete len:322 (-) Transcript_32125:29-994(-)
MFALAAKRSFFAKTVPVHPCRFSRALLPLTATMTSSTTEASDRKRAKIDVDAVKDSAPEAVTEGEYDDQQAKSYVEAKSVDMRNRVELYSTLHFIGDLKNKRVIDMACGSGWLTRHLRDGGASSVVGTDMSPYMIDLAKKEEETYTGTGPKVEYEVEDARKATVPDKLFDIVTSNWLLVNAKNKQEVKEMCLGLAGKAKSGAKLCTIVIHPDLFTHANNDELNQIMKPYGFTFVLPPKNDDGIQDGAPMRIQCYTPTGELAIELENYYHSNETYIQELEAAGFTSIEIQDKLLLSPEKDDADDWKAFFSCSLLMGITAIKK